MNPVTHPRALHLPTDFPAPKHPRAPTNPVVPKYPASLCMTVLSPDASPFSHAKMSPSPTPPTRTVDGYQGQTLIRWLLYM